MKRLNFKEAKSYSSIALIINRDRSSDRLCTVRGVRTCLKKLSTSVKSMRVYTRKLGFAALAFIDAEVNADSEISGRELQKRMQEKLHVNDSISLINRERREMGWVQTSTRYCQNEYRQCRDAQSLSKWAVFEMFSLQELVGRNCLGGGHDISADGNAEIKKPFDEF